MFCVRRCLSGTEDEPGSHVDAAGAQSHLKRYDNMFPTPAEPNLSRLLGVCYSAVRKGAEYYNESVSLSVHSHI